MSLIEQKKQIEAELGRLRDIAANVKDGRDGSDGKDGQDGIDGKDGAEGAPGGRGNDGTPGENGKDGRGVVSLAIDGDTKELFATYSDGVVEILGVVRGERGESGRDGADGKDGQDGRAGTDGKDGADGKDGKDVDENLIVSAACEAAELAIKSLPVPKDGKDGRDGIDGKDGADADPELIALTVSDAVEKAVASLPAPKDGRDGVDGKDGSPGLEGRPGRDAADIAGAFRTYDGKCILTLTDGRMLDLGMIQGKDGLPGRDGADGKDGRDGYGFDDLEFVQESPRIGKLRFVRGDQIKEFPVIISGHIYHGVYQPDFDYKAGDTCTYASGLWVAKEDTRERPGDGGTSWQLAVKGGISGASAYDIACQKGFRGTKNEWLESLKGEKGDTGRPGRDLTLMTGQ